MLKGEGDESQIVKFKPHHTKRVEMQRLKLPEEITVRFTRVRLSKCK